MGPIESECVQHHQKKQPHRQRVGGSDVSYSFMAFQGRRPHTSLIQFSCQCNSTEYPYKTGIVKNQDPDVMPPYQSSCTAMQGSGASIPSHEGVFSRWKPF